MLLKHLNVGKDASWLPIKEIELGGGGGICSRGAELVKERSGLYLPFVKNAINTEIHGGDVISYNFTGCIMAAYVSKQDGIPRVCHVSTGDGQDCKAEWNKIKKNATDVIEFKPSDYIETKGKAFKGCYGLITSKREMYSITVCVDNFKKIITAVKKIKSK